MEKYTSAINELIEKEILSESDIFRFENDPMKDIFNSFYDFCMKDYEENKDKYNLQNFYVVIINDYTPNAKAVCHLDYNLIKINMGLIDSMHARFEDAQEILSDEDYRYIDEICKHLDTKLSVVVLQYLLVFIYYHELGHLLQQHPQIANFQEIYTIGLREIEALSSQVREYDADIFAACGLAYRLLSQVIDLSTIDQKTFSVFLTLALSSILTNFIILTDCCNSINYLTTSHPHPMIRFNYIINIFGKALESMLPSHLHLDNTNVARQSLQLTERALESCYEGKTKFILNQSWEEIKNAKAHIERLKIEALQCSNLTVNSFLSKYVNGLQL